MILEECRILLVDDEQPILDMNQKMLREKGFQHIETAPDAVHARELMEKTEFQLVVLDIMMPGMDGFSLYEYWMKQGGAVPIIFLSARDEEASRLKGLGLGADDYLTKPYTLEELYLRIKAVLRRTYHLTENKKIILGNASIDLLSGTVYNKDKRYELTAKEYILFSKLYDNRGKIVSMNALMDALWPDGSYGLENSLVVHIRRLREKVEENPSKPKYIQTLRGLGYRLNGKDES